MPAKSKNQLKLIWSIRNKYKSKTKAPKKWKWVFGEEWVHLDESHIFKFDQFNEAMSTLSNEDNEEIDDLILDFVETNEISSERFNEDGYYQIQRFDRFHLHLTFQIIPFKLVEKRRKFEEELTKLIERIKKFNYDVVIGSFGMEFSNKLMYNFQISHTDDRSKEIINNLDK